MARVTGSSLESYMIRFKLLGTVAILSTLTAAQPQANGTEGREVAAPPWSAACMTDHGPTQCDEPMWIYGSRGALARYKNAF
jgi:hypothetical protein